MLTVLETRKYLYLNQPGQLVRWIGPALRGLTARHFKAQVCRYSPEEQETTRKYCKGCPHMSECAYGQTFEPDAPASDDGPRGMEDAVRPVVLAPMFPLPTRGNVGQIISIRVLLIGPAAFHGELLWHMIAEAGQDESKGLGPDRITFEVCSEADSNDPQDQNYLVDLPTSPTALAGIVPRIQVELLSPLILRSSTGEGKKRLIDKPDFGDLFRASLRTVGRCLALYSERLPDEVFHELKEAAIQVPTIELDFRRFSQMKWSNRSQSQSVITGIVGRGVYGPVPFALVRWLIWGGVFGVGNNRVAGAGNWAVKWSAISDANKLNR